MGYFLQYEQMKHCIQRLFYVCSLDAACLMCILESKVSCEGKIFTLKIAKPDISGFPQNQENVKIVIFFRPE